MTDMQLVSYIKTSLRKTYDLDLPVTAHRERTIMASLKKTYGVDAGRIVKWALLSGPVVYSDFSPGCKWKTDRWAIEMQQHLKKNMKGAVAPGLARLEDL
jgi:hypothetical protein